MSDDKEEELVDFPRYPDATMRHLTRLAQERGTTVEEIMSNAVNLLVEYDLLRRAANEP